MNRNNRIIYDQLGNIWLQTGEAMGDIQEWSEITELNFLDVEFGSIDYSKQYIESINPITKEPILKDIPIYLSKEEKRIQELENQLLIAENEKVGGIL
ncbi:Uncharacterised protein [Clostridioides difficile]|uniref:hypothetical protein n=1 Tax=Clostridioides difficile TaxID=1496 RepID=UPI00097FEE3D|nr:hypothetical protein [Clostridioides difficile]MDV9763555.1 hypothetical protein [Clostridioides difficile]SJP48602.1 Uncharacterised protein [Clostridioides difficile]